MWMIKRQEKLINKVGGYQNDDHMIGKIYGRGTWISVYLNDQKIGYNIRTVSKTDQSSTQPFASLMAMTSFWLFIYLPIKLPFFIYHNQS